MRTLKPRQRTNGDSTSARSNQRSPVLLPLAQGGGHARALDKHEDERHAVTLGGQTYEGSFDGSPVAVAPRSEQVSALTTLSTTSYSVTVPSTSAAIVHVPLR